MMYEPYKFDALSELMKHSYRLGWFGGTPEVFRLSCYSGFEAFSGRASETWEHEFRVTLTEIKVRDKVINPSGEFRGKTINDACEKALKAIAELASALPTTPDTAAEQERRQRNERTRR